MTTKEALTELFNEANRFPFERPKYDTYDLLRMCEQIQKDLDVLETLKHLINDLEETFNTKYFSKECSIIGTIIRDYFINNDITGKIEEWLEDDKRNDTAR